MWSRGRRHLRASDVARPRLAGARVVRRRRRDEDELVLFAPIGAEAWFSGVPIPQRRLDAEAESRSRRAPRSLSRGRERAIRRRSIWDADWTLREWYVNFERPVRPQSPVGFDYVDLALDLVCYPDGRWELLDEDELEDGLATRRASPRRTRPRACRCRAAGRGVAVPDRLGGLAPRSRLGAAESPSRVGHGERELAQSGCAPRAARAEATRASSARTSSSDRGASSRSVARRSE